MVEPRGGRADDRQGPHEIKEAAVEHGRDMARNLKAEHIIRGLDGRFHERNSYGNDLRNTPGWFCPFLWMRSSRHARMFVVPDRRRNRSLQRLRERSPCLDQPKVRQERSRPATIGPWRRQRLLRSPTISMARRTQQRSLFRSMVWTTRLTCRRKMLPRWRRLSSRTSMRQPRSVVEVVVRDARGPLEPLGRARTSQPFVNGRGVKGLKCPTEDGSPPLLSSSTTLRTSFSRFLRCCQVHCSWRVSAAHVDRVPYRLNWANSLMPCA